MVWIKTCILYSKVIVDQAELCRRLASPGRSGQADRHAQRCKITSVSRRCSGEARMHAHPNLRVLKSALRRYVCKYSNTNPDNGDAAAYLRLSASFSYLMNGVCYIFLYSVKAQREGLLLGMGNPLLDISATVDDDFLKKYQLNSNDAILAQEKHKPMYDELIEQYKADFIAGGSVQNTMRVAQWFLEKPRVATYMGCVGVDKYSKILEEKARADGLNVRYQYTNKESTGTCAVLITGSERSLCANLAAANCFSLSHIEEPENKKFVEAAEYIYVSGFFLTVSPETIQAVAQHAYERNKMFMMNLSAPFLCEFYKEPMLAALPYVDILFGNEIEADTFAKVNDFQTTDRKEIALKLSEMRKMNEKRKRIVVITQGADNILVAKDNKLLEFPAIKLPKEKVVDTNGAGDAFVGGFLAQLIQGKDIEVCVKCGIWAATQIVQRSGCTYEGKPTFAL
uniref:adenosine kinase 2-like isoform X5 n=1 Tax=Osmia lignaria TaxID=473952 RepID=UPI00147853B1|nr:adenosine kinase 2-like isoform X5 [Osmia lignaria]